ncbi:hypothetical protein J2X16_000353 [Pelomonas aquatica]|uniref:Uncharacterized protein n=1 Tax=Pelomonas aquatica TaxID=431058 RepID=A0ABU1Z334_9BURK|nr:hypothetical protein [Pelomonas aquatica]MDR7295032.1 hypothetical protein [Pelomonas aquatica]
MKFAPEKPGNPLNTAVVGVIAHGLAFGGAGLALYWSLQDHSFLPLGIAFAVLTGLEGLFVYASRR